MTTRWVKIVCFLCLFFWIGHSCHHFTRGFFPEKVYADLPYAAKWDTTPLNGEQKTHIDQCLAQPFYFLGCGGQSFAFISQDEQTVIKLIKRRHLISDRWIDRIDRVLPANLRPLRMKIAPKQSERMPTVLSSYKTAYETLQNETGLIYVHLNPTADLQPLTVFDKLGIAHRIDLNRAKFALQKKADLICDHLQALIDRGDTAQAKAAIQSYLKLILSRCHQGIRDNDKALKRNYGFVLSQAVAIDIGSFTLDTNLLNHAHQQIELTKRTKRLKKWLLKHSPDLLPFLQSELATLI
jgi:hypothetical protein